jgi:hypothetical protein
MGSKYPNGLEANVTGNLTGNVTGNVTGNTAGVHTGAVTGDVTGNVSGYAVKSEARTATADGTGTGQISAGTTHVVVTSDNADKIITLPAPVLGLRIVIQNAGTGYELRTSAPATIAINGGVSAAAESAIAANITTTVTCVSATAWIGASQTAAGVVGVTQVAAD